MRYLPQTKNSRAAMLKSIGCSSVDDLYKDVSKDILNPDIDLPDHMGELAVERDIMSYANQNHPAALGPFFLGAGCYNHHIPATVDYVIQRSEFLTAYTPYQPEIAQGTLTAIFEFQSFISQLTGQEIANASLYDGATATAEAMLMAMRITKRQKVILANELHPDYKAVLETYAGNVTDAAIETGAPCDQTACVILQTPDFHGTPHTFDDLRKKCDETGALLIVVITEIVSLGLLPAPVEADIVCGEGQSIGLPMSFGGPHLGFFATKEKFVRQMPGRLCGMTHELTEEGEKTGRRGFVLTLNTREQHIRREKATSNICTNQGLCALAFTVHMALLGEDGFKRLARLNHEAARKLANELNKVEDIEVENEHFFNEFVVKLPTNAKALVDQLTEQDIIAGYPLEDNRLLVCATELTTDEDIETFCSALAEL